jgi:predicted exporter
MKGFAARLRLLPRCMRWAASVWLLVVLLLAVHQWHFWRSPALGVDVFALLPQDARHAAADEAARRLAQQLARQVVVVVGGEDWVQVSASARELSDRLTAPGAAFQSGAHTLDPGRALAAYAPWRDALLTPAQREALQQPDRDAWLHQAMGRLYGMGSVGQPVAWLSDPMGLWRDWWAERGELTAARPRDGMLWVADDISGQHWAVVLLETRATPFRLDGANLWQDAIDQAWADVAQRPGPALTIHAAGVPLHAEAGAVQGHREMSTIGGGAILGVVVMTALVFGGVRPLLPIALSVAVGCAAGLSAVNLLFGQVHLLTLVFGASLVGVAVDYGFHYFCARAGASGLAATTVRRLLPTLTLALLTSTLGYMVLGVAPFPGLRQMAVFSAAGLLGAFATVVLWFPLLEGRHVRITRVGQSLAATLLQWPRPGPWVGAFLVALFAAFVLAGGVRLSVSDDIRQLHASPQRLVQAQGEVSRLLGMASPSQLFLVRGASEDAVLQQEEALKARLAAQGADSGLAGVRVSGMSDWVPSAAQQAADRGLTAAAEAQVIADVARMTGEPLTRPAFAEAPLTVSALLASEGAPRVAQAQWLGRMDAGYASVMLIHGLRDAGQAQALRALADGLPGVTWVDRAADVGALLGTFRVSMAWLLIGAHLLILVVLTLRLRSRGWRAWLPCALATLTTMGWLGWLGEPFQLFNLLALVLLLGMGVDYGIFLQAQPDSDRTHAWLAILLAAFSTALSFGLLALSSTPALRAFGLTLLIGLLHVSLIAPFLVGGVQRRQVVTNQAKMGEDNESRTG